MRNYEFGRSNWPSQASNLVATPATIPVRFLLLFISSPIRYLREQWQQQEQHDLFQRLRQCLATNCNPFGVEDARVKLNQSSHFELGLDTCCRSNKPLTA